MRDYLQLHFVILLWGLTAVLGNLIDLSATQIVLIRATLAAVILFAIGGRHVSLPAATATVLVANGMLLGLHWVLFFLAVKVANVSICMIGMATVSFWTAILEPALIRTVRFQVVNLILGGLVILAVYAIFRSESEFSGGLAIALTAALAATLFSIVNGQLAGRVNVESVVMYEMAGAALFCFLAIPVADRFGIRLTSDRWLLQPLEWIWMAILVLGGTVLAYQMYVRLLERLSVFSINFANNLEPVYGITLGALFFADHRFLGDGFYLGTAIILAVVVIQPWLARRPDPQGLP